MSKKRRLLSWGIPVGIVLIAVIVFAITSSIQRDKLLDSYVQIPQNSNLSEFINGQDNLELVATFREPEEIKHMVDDAISSEVYESELVSFTEARTDADQVNYLFKISGTEQYATVSYIEFDNSNDALAAFDAANNEILAPGYVSPQKVNFPELKKDFFLPYFGAKGYSVHDVSSNSNQIIRRAYWFDGNRGIRLLADAEHYETIRGELVNYCKEN